MSQNIKQLQGGKFLFSEKISLCQKKLKGTLWDFPTSILSQNRRGDPLRKNNSREKSLTVPKTMEGGPFGLAGYGMLRGKQEKPFWFSSLDQIVHFGAILFCRTFVEEFWWIEKKEKPL